MSNKTNKIKRPRRTCSSPTESELSGQSSNEESDPDTVESTKDGVPRWIKKPEKKNITAIIQGKYSSLAIIKKPHNQSTGYSKIFIETSENVLYPSDHVFCNFCEAVMNKNGGHLKRHRDSRCKSSMANISLPTSSSATKSSTKRDFDETLVNYFAKSGKPLYNLENLLFREMILEVAKLGQAFEGEITTDIVLKRSRGRSIVESRLEEKTKEIIDLVLPAFDDQTASILADFGKLNVDFLSIKSGILLTQRNDEGVEHWKLIIFPIAMSPVNMKSKNADEVFKGINEGLEKVSPLLDLSQFYLVADGGSNIRRAGKIHFHSYIRCAAHATEIVGKRMLSPYKKHQPTEAHKKILSKYSNMLNLCKKLTTDLKADKLRYKKLAISLTTPTDTRWMSIYNCASNVYSNMTKLIAQLPNLEKREECLVLELATNENRQLYAEIHEIFSPLKECTLYFQRNDTTISDVIPAYLGLLDDIKQFSEKPNIHKNNKTLLLYAQKSVLKQIDDLSDAHYAAYYLNPEYKNLSELQKRLDNHNVMLDAEKIVSETINKLDRIINTDIAPTSPSPQSSSATSTDSFLKRRMSKTPPPAVQTMASERLSYETHSAAVDPLYFWPASKSRFPRLFNIAKKVFSTPASEADVERSFSVLKSIYSDNRQSLDLDFLQKLMLVKQFETL